MMDQHSQLETTIPPPPGRAPRRPRAIYIVLLSLGRWWVDFEGKPFGPFTDKEEARRSAIEIARVFGDEDRERQVVVVREGGGFDIVWTSRDAAIA